MQQQKLPRISVCWDCGFRGTDQECNQHSAGTNHAVFFPPPDPRGRIGNVAERYEYALRTIDHFLDEIPSGQVREIIRKALDANA